MIFSVHRISNNLHIMSISKTHPVKCSNIDDGRTEEHVDDLKLKSCSGCGRGYIFNNIDKNDATDTRMET